MATGLRKQRLAKGQIWRWYERSTGETVHVKAPIFWKEDFQRAVVPASTPVGLDVLQQRVVLTVGSPSVALAATASNEAGAVDLTIDATAELQTAALDSDNKRMFYVGDTTSGSTSMQFETRVKIVTLLDDAAAFMFFGLGSDRSTSPSAIAQRVGFLLNGDGAFKVVTDDGTTDSGNVATGVTATADDQYRILRADISDLSNVKFYIDGVRVASSTTFGIPTVQNASAVLQPILQVSKTGGTGVGKVRVDYAMVWGTR